MLIRKLSPMTGKINEMEVDCTNDELEAWQRGKLIQDAMPRADATQREFLISGLTAEEQKQFFGW
jgi:hypothetical protein